MISHRTFWSTVSTPFGVVWGMLAGILIVAILLRVAERGVAFGQWLASRSM